MIDMLERKGACFIKQKSKQLSRMPFLPDECEDFMIGGSDSQILVPD